MTIHVMDIELIQKFSPDEVQHIVLHKSEGLVTILLCLEPGQMVGPCVMSARVQYFVMAGSGQLNVKDEQAQLKTGSVVVVPAEVVRRSSSPMLSVPIERQRLFFGQEHFVQAGQRHVADDFLPQALQGYLR